MARSMRIRLISLVSREQGIDTRVDWSLIRQDTPTWIRLVGRHTTGTTRPPSRLMRWEGQKAGPEEEVSAGRARSMVSFGVGVDRRITMLGRVRFSSLRCLSPVS
jgi:hypothetical protein